VKKKKNGLGRGYLKYVSNGGKKANGSEKGTLLVTHQLICVQRFGVAKRHFKKKRIQKEGAGDNRGCMDRGKFGQGLRESRGCSPGWHVPLGMVDWYQTKNPIKKREGKNEKGREGSSADKKAIDPYRDERGEKTPAIASQKGRRAQF